jgi:TPR repeat protein
MRKLLITIFSICTTGLLAQSQSLPTDGGMKGELRSAKSFLNPKSSTYNPQKAFQIYDKYASQGYAEAINGLAVMYNTGIGAPLNEREAFSLFIKATTLNYPKALYNLGLMYKDGIGTEQNFKKAFECFNKGARLNDGQCWYGRGYLLYKGFGTAQNYSQAFLSFKKGISFREVGSMYMIGLCFRNGYGTAMNLDSARYWLSKAASRGDNRAKEELADANPENLNIQQVSALQMPRSAGGQPLDLKSGFKTVKHYLPNEGLNGAYEGYAVKFDWSGKHIISQVPLRLTLESKDKSLSGQWFEDGQETVSLTGQLTDTAVTLSSTSNQQKDHYNREKRLLVNFTDLKLNLVQSKDTVYLSGNLQLYSPQTREPEKPQFVLLTRTGAKEQQALTALNDRVDSLQMVAYPNPFTSNLKLKYSLKQSAQVNVIVSDLITGRIVYRTIPELKQEGEHISPVSFNGQPGNYVITLQYGSKVKSAIVFKQ